MLSTVKGTDSDVNYPYVEAKKQHDKGAGAL